MLITCCHQILKAELCSDPTAITIPEPVCNEEGAGEKQTFVALRECGPAHSKWWAHLCWEFWLLWSRLLTFQHFNISGFSEEGASKSRRRYIRNNDFNICIYLYKLCFVVCAEVGTHLANGGNIKIKQNVFLVGQDHCHLLPAAQIFVFLNSIQFRSTWQSAWTMHSLFCTVAHYW